MTLAQFHSITHANVLRYLFMYVSMYVQSQLFVIYQCKKREHPSGENAAKKKDKDPNLAYLQETRCPQIRRILSRLH
jgi:hypothetical protein